MRTFQTATALLGFVIAGLVASQAAPAHGQQFTKFSFPPTVIRPNPPAVQTHFVYHQRTGELWLGNKLWGRGYSGRDKGLNNPQAERVANMGPIPAGRYTIGAPHHSDRTGPFVMNLTSIGHTAYGRHDFEIHGDNSKLNHTASHGCIILARDVRERIGRSGIHQLVVVP